MYWYRLINLLLIVRVNMRTIPNEAKESFISATHDASTLDVSDSYTRTMVIEGRGYEIGRYSGIDMPRESFTRNIEPLVLPSYSHYQGRRPVRNWTNFNWPTFQYPSTATSNSEPVQMFKPLRVLVDSLLNAKPVPVGIVNSTIPVTIENTSIDANLINLPLAVALVNASLPVNVLNSALRTNVTNLPLPVGIVNSTLTLDVSNVPLAVNVANAPLAVQVINQTLSVTLADEPIPVGVINETLAVNITNSVLNTTLLNLPLPVGVVNSTLNVTVTNPFLPVMIANETVQVNSTMLLDGLTAVLNNMTVEIRRSIEKKRCPLDSNYGNGSSAPCRCFRTSYICFFNTLQRNHSDAETFCKFLGFDGLVSFDNATKQAVLFDIGRLLGTVSTKYWTSGNDIATEGEYVWEPSGTPIDVNLWDSTVPNDLTGQQDCVSANMAKRGLLEDDNCSTSLLFICEARNLASYLS